MSYINYSWSLSWNQLREMLSLYLIGWITHCSLLIRSGGHIGMLLVIKFLFFSWSLYIIASKFEFSLIMFKDSLLISPNIFCNTCNFTLLWSSVVRVFYRCTENEIILLIGYLLFYKYISLITCIDLLAITQYSRMNVQNVGELDKILSGWCKWICSFLRSLTPGEVIYTWKIPSMSLLKLSLQDFPTHILTWRLI
jgi:hypothetical protein